MSSIEIGQRLKSDLVNELGITSAAASGIVGNLAHESAGFKQLQEVTPLVEGSRGGYGFAQWTGSRRRQFEQWSKENNLNPSSYEANKGFLVHELKNTPESKVLKSLDGIKDSQKAAQVFSDEFLRPGIVHAKSRLDWTSKFDGNETMNGGQGNDAVQERKIRLPDKRILVLSGNESPEQLQALKTKLKERYKTQEQPQNQPIQEDPQEQKGFIERVSERASERAGIERDITQARLRGEQGYIESGIQKAGKVGAGLVNDVVGEALTSGFRALPDSIENPIREGVSSGISALNNTFAGDVAKKTVESYGDFAKDHPRAARNIEAAANIGGLVGAATPAKTANALTPVVNATGQGVKKTAKAGVNTALAPVKGTKSLYKGFKARDVEALELAENVISKRSSQAYTKSRELGATFKPEASNKIIDAMENALVSDGRLNPELHKSIISVSNQITDEIKTGNVTLESLDLNRRLLSDIAGNFNDKTNARKATLMIKALDEAIDSVDAADIVNGSKEAIESLKIGRAEYRRARKFEDITTIIKKSDGDANYLKRELKKLADNPKKTRGYTPAELKALKEASRLTAGEGILKMLGKFGIDLGNSRIGNTGLPVIGGVMVGAGSTSGLGLAVPIVGTGARQGQKYIARSKAENLLQTIEGSQGSILNLAQ